MVVGTMDKQDWYLYPDLGKPTPNSWREFVELCKGFAYLAIAGLVLWALLAR